MDSKILVTLEVPSISESYNLLVPGFVPVSTLVPLLVKIAQEMSNHLYQSSGSEFLCSVEKNTLLEKNYTLDAYNIQNGDHLLLL